MALPQIPIPDESVALPPAIRQVLSAHDWTSTTVRLTALADHKRKRLFLQGVRGGAWPGGRESKDLVEEVYEKFFEGKRQWRGLLEAWNQRETKILTQELEQRLHQIIDDTLHSAVCSTLNHVAESRENRLRLVPTNHNNAAQEEDSIAERHYSLDNPESQMMRREKDYLVYRFARSLEDPLLQKYVYLAIADLKPLEIAAQLDIPTKEVYNMRKRLQTQWRAFVRNQGFS
jgi:DNA-directed RNA polymerase specialized sigma24 family protein